jgi:hypothetical protein
VGAKQESRRQDIHVHQLFHAMTRTLAAALALCAQAAVADITWDFRSGQSTSSQFSATSRGFGNIFTFSQGGETVTVRGYAEGVRSNSSIGTAGIFYDGQLGRYNTGLGVCDGEEGASCADPAHRVDNIGYDDWVLFTFPKVVRFTSIVIDPAGNYDRDMTYWFGTAGPGKLPQLLTDGLASDTVLQLVNAFGQPINRDNSAGDDPLEVALKGQGNFLLLGAWRGGTDQDDSFNIHSLTVLPELPPSLLLLIGLIAVGALVIRHGERL